MAVDYNRTYVVYNIKVLRGDTFEELPIEVSDVVGGETNEDEEIETPRDLTGYTIKMDIKDADGVAIKQLSTGSGITITDAPNGHFKIDKFDVDDIPVGMYSYDIQLTSQDSVIKTYVRGKFHVVQDTTDTP